MEKNNFIKNNYSVIIALVLFILASYIYCSPVLEGKIIYAGDNINANAAVQEAHKYHKETGKYTWWNGSMFSGMPAYQIGGGHYISSSFLKPFEKIFLRGHHHPEAVFIIFFICFYILLRAFKVDKWLSIVGAFATGFSSYFFIIVLAGHNGKTSSIALMTVVAAGFYLIFRKKYGLGIILTMLFSAIGFGNHPQMTYYIGMMIGVFYLAELFIHIKEKKYKDLAIGSLLFFASLIVGFGTGSANVFANKEYSEQTMRGGHSELEKSNDSSNKTDGLDLDYATAWSYGIDESLTFLIPGYMGCSSSYNIGKDSELYKIMVKKGVAPASAARYSSAVPLYWGEQLFTAGSVYMGAIVCFLFVLGLILVKGPYKWAILAATLFSIFLSWGHHFMPFTRLFFNYFPMYNKFRTVSSILIVAEITMPLLGFLAIKAIMEEKASKKEIIKGIYSAAGITAGISLLLFLFGNSFCSFQSPNDAQFSSQIPEWLYEAIISQRATMLHNDALRSMIFIVLAASVLWLFVNKKLKTSLMILGIGILIFSDMWSVNKRYLNDDNFVKPQQRSNSFAMKPYEEALLKDPDPNFRVMNLTTSTFQDARTSYYLKSIGGYHAAKLRRYQDMIERHLSKMNMNVIGMLNAKYIITNNKEGVAVPQRNPYAMGNAWFVDSLVMVNTPEEEINALNEINLKNTAVLDDDFEGYVKNLTPGHDDQASVKLISYAPDELNYESTSEKPGTIVFSEVYYPYGWKAYVDDQPVDIFRVNYILRAINIDPGNHKIKLVFRPDSVKKGDTLSLIFIFMMYATMLGIIGMWAFRYFMKKKQIN